MKSKPELVKELVEKELETKTKKKVAEEMGVTVYRVNKLITGGTIKHQFIEEAYDYFFPEVNDTPVVTEEEFKEELPKLTKEEAEMFDVIEKDTVYQKVKGIGFVNYTFNSKTGRKSYWFDRLCRYKSNFERKSLLERMGQAVWLGRYELVEDLSEEKYVIKLPSGHYLCKYDDGELGWSIEPNRFTVQYDSVTQMKLDFIDYSEFVTKETIKLKPSYQNKKRGFSIRDSIR